MQSFLMDQNEGVKKAAASADSDEVGNRERREGIMNAGS